MDPNILSAIISGICGIIGVVLGVVLKNSDDKKKTKNKNLIRPEEIEQMLLASFIIPIKLLINTVDRFNFKNVNAGIVTIRDNHSHILPTNIITFISKRIHRMEDFDPSSYGTLLYVLAMMEDEYTINNLFIKDKLNNVFSKRSLKLKMLSEQTRRDRLWKLEHNEKYDEYQNVSNSGNSFVYGDFSYNSAEAFIDAQTIYDEYFYRFNYKQKNRIIMFFSNNWKPLLIGSVIFMQLFILFMLINSYLKK